MSDNFWTDEKTLQLINAIKKYPTIWSRSSSKYYSKEERQICWNKIENEMDFPLVLVKHKYFRLGEKFSKEALKQERNPNYKSSWTFLKALDFLKFSSRRCNKLKPSEPVIADDVSLVDSEDTDSEVTNANVAKNRKINTDKQPAVDATNDLENEFVLYVSDNETEALSLAESTTTSYWNYENTVAFINLVRVRRVIWDENNADYFNKAKQEKAWAEIVKATDLPLSALKVKFNDLITTYYNEREQIRNNRLHVISWVFFPDLEFLPLTQKIDTINIADLADHKAAATRLSIEQCESSKKSNRKTAKKSPTNFEATKKLRLNKNLRDEYTSFGDAVANEMRQMNDYKTIQKSFKQKVLKLLSEARKANN